MGFRQIFCALLVIRYLQDWKNGFTDAENYIPSRGRSGSIHQFYDQRVQTLRPYMLTDLDHSTSNVASSAYGGSTLKRIVTMTFSEYVEKLKIGGEAKPDLLLNIFEGGLRGQGISTNLERTSSSSVLAFVEIIQYTKQEKTDLCDPKSRKHFQLHLLNADHIQATHIIKGKQYGLYLKVILEIQESEDESNSNLEVDVQAELDSFLARIDASASVSKLSASKKYLSKSKILTYCNLVNCPTPPNNIEQLEIFIKNSLGALTLYPDAQGNEISLIADDIRSLTDCWNFTNTESINKTKSHELSGQNVNYIETVIREIEEGVNNLYKFQKKIFHIKECVPEDVIFDMQHSTNEAMSFANVFKGKLKRFVIYVRFGKRDQDSISKKIKHFRSNGKNPKVALERLNMRYSNWIKKANFYYTLLKAHMYCLPSKLNLLTLFENSRHQTHVLYLMGNQSLQDNDGFIENLSTFANICPEKCNNCSCYIVDCYFDFSFCTTFEANQILMYKQGILSLYAANNTPNSSLDDYALIQQALLFMYVQDAKTMKVLSILNEKIDAYFNAEKSARNTRNVTTSVFGTFNNLTVLFEHDSLDRQTKQRTDKNPVEKLLKKFIDF